MFRNKVTRVIIVIYVNDVLLIVKLLESIFGTAKLIGDAFPIQLLGKLHYYLGIRIIRNREHRQLVVVQDAYIDKIVSKFDLIELYPTATGVPLGKVIAL